MLKISDNSPNENNKNLNDNSANRENSNISNNQRTSTFQFSPESQQYVESQLGMVKFLDYMTEESYDFIYTKIFDTYLQKFMPNHQNSDSKRLDVEGSLKAIKDKSELIAKNNGLNQPFIKKFNKMNMIVMGTFLTLFIALQFVNLGDFTLYLTIPLMLGMCFLPQVLKKKMMAKWKEFKYQHRAELEEELGDEIQRIREYIQIIIDDTREFLLEKEFPLQLISFALFSNKYDNLTLQKEQIINDQVQYLFSIAYPPGVEPFPVPGKIINSGTVGAQSARSDMDISEDDENDLFIVLSNANYTENGNVVIKDTKIIKNEILIELSEKMLDDSSFSKVGNPDEIIPELKNNSQILCKCNESIRLGELQEAQPAQYPEFNYYLGIAQKCQKCGANPFVLFQKNDTNVPPELKELFGN